MISNTNASNFALNTKFRCESFAVKLTQRNGKITKRNNANLQQEASNNTTMPNNTKEQRAQKRAIIEAHVKERTHRQISVKMPIELADRLKKEAKANNKIFSGHVLETIERGMLS